MKGKQIWQQILMIGISVFIALIIAEVGLRLFYNNKDTLCVFPPNLHYEFDPDSSIIHGVYGKKNFDTDRIGIRKFDSSDPNEYEILFIGGSTTECLYLDNKETWPYLVAKQLGMKGGSIGKSGQTSYDHYMQMKYFVPQLKKLKTVVVMCGLNDFLKFVANRDYIPHLDQHLEDSLYQVSFTHTNQFTSAKGLRLKQLFKNVYRNLKPDTTGQAMQDIHGYCYNKWRAYRREATSIIDDGFDSISLPKAAYEYRLNLRLMISEAKKNRINLVFLPQLYMWSDTMSQSEKDMMWMGGIGDYQIRSGHSYQSFHDLYLFADLYNQITKEECERAWRKATEIEMERKGDDFRMDSVNAHVHFFSIKINREPYDYIFYDDCHYTQRGAMKLSKQLYPYLQLYN